MLELIANRNQLNGWFLKTERTLCAHCGQLPFSCELTAFHRETVIDFEEISTARQDFVWGPTEPKRQPFVLLSTQCATDLFKMFGLGFGHVANPTISHMHFVTD